MNSLVKRIYEFLKPGIWIDGREIVTKEELKDPLVKSFYQDKECPDCKGKQFSEGPRGGMNVNIQCVGCGSKFNICPEIGYIERI